MQGLSKSPLLAPPVKGFSFSTISPRVPLLYTLSRDNPTSQTIPPDPLALPTRGPPLLPRSALPALRDLSPHPLRAPPPQRGPGERVSVPPSAPAPRCSVPLHAERPLGPPGPPAHPRGQPGRSGPHGSCPARPGRSLTSVKEIASSRPVPWLGVRESSSIGGCSFSFLSSFFLFPFESRNLKLVVCPFRLISFFSVVLHVAVVTALIRGNTLEVSEKILFKSKSSGFHNNSPFGQMRVLSHTQFSVKMSTRMMRTSCVL